MLSNLYRQLFEQMPLIGAVLWMFFTVFGAIMLIKLERALDKKHG